VDREIRLIACNRRAEALLGRVEESLLGLMGGEFMECRNAQMPEGCGRTSLCPGCPLRGSITGVLVSGKPVSRLPAHIRVKDKGKEAVREMVISAEKEGELIRITIHEEG
jgi:hypothetical protein